MSDGPHPDDDARLLADVARVWQLADPPPEGLVAGVLARIAAEDLELDLLTLVASSATPSGVRSAAGPDADPRDAGTWTLEYAAADVRIHLTLTRSGDRTRLDGWVVPARPLTVRLVPPDTLSGPATTVDEFGRFELTEVREGLARLVLLAEGDRARITPPFWI
jgi:hypothetical protein